MDASSLRNLKPRLKQDEKAPRPGRDGSRPRSSVLSNSDANTTGSEIAERAGLSRGAQLYHFPTEEGLFAKAVEHLCELMFNEMRHKMERLPVEADLVPSRSISFGKPQTAGFTRRGRNW